MQRAGRRRQPVSFKEDTVLATPHSELARLAADQESIVNRALAGETGAQWLFRSVVEPFCDSFDPTVQPAHDSVVAAVVSEAIRRDTGLRHGYAGPVSAAGMLSRIRELPVHGVTYEGRPDVCVIPSRVTIGADVAVTATVAAVVRAAWPGTSIVVLGTARQLAPLLGAFPGTEVRDHPYPRRGSFAARLRAFGHALGTVREVRRQAPGRIIVLDPDSRYTQLGLLTLVQPGEPERVFRSRHQPVGDHRSLRLLTADWARQVCGLPDSEVLGPVIRPPAADMDRGRSLVRTVRHRSGRPVLVATIGVGGNPAKAVPEAEVAMLTGVCRRAAVLLDTGATAEEESRASVVARAVARNLGAPLWDVTRAGTTAECGPGPIGLLRNAGVAAVAGVLASADGYVGYDSAFQHIAAALGVPSISLFVRPPSPTFVHRWCPETARPVVVTWPDAATADVDRAVSALLQRRRST